MCDAYIQINGCRNKSYFRSQFGKHLHEVLDGAAIFSKKSITASSTVEYSTNCRAFTSEKNDLELDQLICIGEIDKVSCSNNLTPVKNHAGYFRLNSGFMEIHISILQRSSDIRLFISTVGKCKIGLKRVYLYV